MKKVIRLNENDIEKLVRKIIKENHEFFNKKKKDESNNYMFWQNLQTIKEAVDGMLEMNKEEVDEILSDGHGWALDHLATSADDVEEVYHFLEGNGSEEEPSEDMKGYHDDEKIHYMSENNKRNFKR